MTAKRKILVIDDDQTVCDIISRSLTNRGYEVYTETQHQKGIEKAGEIVPDLICIGLLLHASNGLKVSKEIHALEELRKVPVVMIISYKGELDPKYTLAIGIVDVLVKPLNESDIIAKTEAILGPDVMPRTGEEVTPEISDIGESPEAAEELVYENTEATDGEIIKLEEYPDDLHGMIDDEGSLNQEPAHRTGDASSGKEETREELSPESGFERLSDEIAEQKSMDENYAEHIYDEDQAQTDDVEIHEEDGISRFDKGDKGSPRNKILAGAVVLALIAVIGTATYLGLQFFWESRDRSVVLQKTPLKDKSEVRKTETESLPQADAKRSVDDKAKKSVPSASDKNVKKEEVSTRTNAVKEKEKGPPPQKSLTAKETIMKKGQEKEVFSAQIGFFGNLKNAESLAEKMKQKGYPVFLKKVEKGTGKISYRVTVGKFSSRKEAAEQAAYILQREGMKAILYKE